MEDRPVRRRIGEGIYFTAVREPKFKSNRMTAVLIAPLERTKATARALVPFLLRKGCGAYPDFTALNEKLPRCTARSSTRMSPNTPIFR
jgi:hypothetical protein